MNCLDNENVCSVKKENNLGYYRLHTIWRKDGFFINVTSKNGSWRGEMTPKDVLKMSAQLEVEPESYVNECKKALTYHGGHPGMVYAVEDGTFTWKKVEDEDSGIKVKIGSVMLEPTNFVDTIQNLVTAALNCNQILEQKLKEATTENIKILENRNELLKNLKELLKSKEAMENDLYTRFILLTNTKKRKIHELENLLEEKYKNKCISPKNSNKLYEIDTDSDSSEESKISCVNKLKMKPNKILSMKIRTKSPLIEDIPEEKKSKNSEIVAGGKIDSECSNDIRMNSPEPSTSTVAVENQGEITDKMELTQDALYNYFYGEL